VQAELGALKQKLDELLGVSTTSGDPLQQAAAGAGDAATHGPATNPQEAESAPHPAPPAANAAPATSGDAGASP
jgi:hypothetical protein